MNSNNNRETAQEFYQRAKKTPINNVMIIVACIIGMVVTLDVVDGVKWLLFDESPISQNAKTSRESVEHLRNSIDAAKKQSQQP